MCFGNRIITLEGIPHKWMTSFVCCCCYCSWLMLTIFAVVGLCIGAKSLKDVGALCCSISSSWRLKSSSPADSFPIYIYIYMYVYSFFRSTHDGENMSGTSPTTIKHYSTLNTHTHKSYLLLDFHTLFFLRTEEAQTNELHTRYFFFLYFRKCITHWMLFFFGQGVGEGRNRQSIYLPGDPTNFGDGKYQINAHD